MSEPLHTYCLDRLNKQGRHTDRVQLHQDLIVQLAKALDQANRRIAELENRVPQRNLPVIEGERIPGS